LQRSIKEIVAEIRAVPCFREQEIGPAYGQPQERARVDRHNRLDEPEADREADQADP
jgi:hypothetical protein